MNLEYAIRPRWVQRPLYSAVAEHIAVWGRLLRRNKWHWPGWHQALATKGNHQLWSPATQKLL